MSFKNYSPRFRRGTTLALISALALMGLTACGSSDQSAAPDGPIKLRVSVANIQFETAYLAQSEGIFEEQGLDVEIVTGADPASQIAQAISGEVDIATGAWTNVATSAAQGVPIKAVAGNGLVDADIDNSGVMVAKDSEISSLKDLKGKTVGVVGIKTGSDIPLFQALEAVGINEGEFSEVSVPYAGMQAALEQHTVDAVLPSGTFYQQMIDAGFTSLANPIREFQGNQPGTLWVATDQWLGANAETAQKFVDAMRDAVSFYQDPENLEAVRKTNAEVNQIDVDKAPTTFVPASVDFNIAESQSGLDAMAHFGLIEKPVTTEEVLWDKAPRRDSTATK